MLFVDANIFLRAILQDDREKAENCIRLFEKIDRNKIGTATSLLVINEIVWVLEGLGVEQKEIENRVNAIAQSNIKIVDGLCNEKILEALRYYRDAKIDFVNIINALIARDNRIKQIVSYDKHFDKINLVERVEPQDV